ncbi:MULTISPECIES: tetratricopeptide repeat protein [Emticicia]|uniref:tetratricopeptide repeat protein n=1 Tax=Emticicia TaxID=312278 RepID=UPI0020A16FD2|nr:MULTISPECIES: hypothetical protein [Emticicia]UTA66136.1 hypothetical protein MB380_10980 [Emticicia sp. 21SJ11W-3]
MEALLIGIPFMIFIYLRIRLGQDVTPQEYDEILFKEGVVYYNNADYLAAFRYFNLAVLNYPKSSTAYLFRGKCHYYFENWEAALADFEKSIRIDNALAETFRWKALCHYHLEDYKMSLFELKRASRMYLDKNPEVMRMIGELEFRTADFESAEKSFKIAARLGDNQSTQLLKTLFFEHSKKASS